MAPTSADTQNPYLNGVTPEYPAAAAFLNDRYMQLARSVRNWQLMAGGLLLTTLSLTGGIVYVTSQQQLLPYLVQVDDAGSAAVIKELRASSVIDPRVLQALLTHWLRDIRTIPADGQALQRQMNAAPATTHPNMRNGSTLMRNSRQCCPGGVGMGGNGSMSYNSDSSSANMLVTRDTPVTCRTSFSKSSARLVSRSNKR